MPDLMLKAKDAFAEIYAKDLWGLSKMGPIEDRLASYAQVLQAFIDGHNIRSVVEVGCGIWSYAKLMNWDGIEYHGYDVVPSLIQHNLQFHASQNIKFHIMDDSTKLAASELLVSKDVLQHLPNSDALHLISLFREAAPVSIVINDVVPDANTNGVIERGGYRAIRLDLEPFNEVCETLHEWESTDFGVFCRKRAVVLHRCS